MWSAARMFPRPIVYTKCVTDLDYQSEMILFKSILTFFFNQALFLEAAGAVHSVNRLEFKIEPPSANLACPNL
jgi:hypothetical protein